MSNTDRELLEWAAKNAGYEIDFNRQMDCGAYTLYWNATTGEWWNPLADDGDALRLAVRLRISIDVRDSGACSMPPSGKAIIVAGAGGELIPATRRAIVRAAAGIGKAMSYA